MSLPGFVEGNHITLLHSGTEYFPALESAIDTARHEIHLETYICQYDATGSRIDAVLKRAAQRGVAVHLLVDGFGSLGLSKKVIRELLETGVQVLVYRPEFFSFRLKRHRLRRMHRKLAIMDISVAFVGGINIIDDYHEDDALLPRFDYAVEIRGPLLEKIHAAARHLWMLVAWVHFKKRWTNYPLITSSQPAGRQRAAFVIRDNLRNRRNIERCYHKAMAAARREIIIANAYFFPGKNFRQALISGTTGRICHTSAAGEDRIPSAALRYPRFVRQSAGRRYSYLRISAGISACQGGRYRPVLVYCRFFQYRPVQPAAGTGSKCCYQ